MFKTLPAELSPWRRKRKMRMRRSAEGSVSSAARRCTERRAGFFIYGVAAVNSAPLQPFVHVRAVSQTFLYICKIKKEKTGQVSCVFFCFFCFFTGNILCSLETLPPTLFQLSVRKVFPDFLEDVSHVDDVGRRKRCRRVGGCLARLDQGRCS